MKEKIKNPAALKQVLSDLRSRGMRIVFTNGCFDILHAGHIDYLEKAKKLGDVLVAGLNSDASVRRLKGKTRPLNKQQDRAKVLSALSCIDYITIFSETTPEKLIEKLKPDILVKGGDWKVKDIAGAPFVTSYGGRAVSLPFVKGYSTTALVRKMKR